MRPTPVKEHRLSRQVSEPATTYREAHQTRHTIRRRRGPGKVVFENWLLWGVLLGALASEVFLGKWHTALVLCSHEGRAVFVQ